MSFPYINRVKVEHSHSEFYNSIESFPGQEKLREKLEAMERELPLKEQKLDYLRNELRDLARNPQPQTTTCASAPASRRRGAV